MQAGIHKVMVYDWMAKQQNEIFPFTLETYAKHGKVAFFDKNYLLTKPID